MVSISKITAKHFLNTLLAPKEAVNGNSPDKPSPLYPLYVKITFMRKTTQMRSCIDDNYSTIEEAYKKEGDKMEAETRMIEDVIAREYKKLGDKFELRGIANKCEAYQRSLTELIFGQYLWLDFFNVVVRDNTEHKRMLLTRLPKTRAITYYHAALKLIENNEELQKLNDQFENYEIIERSLRVKRTEPYATVFDWVYGKQKEKFSYTALKDGISFNKTSQLVAIIEATISGYLEKL
jgi:hypothetical protein